MAFVIADRVKETSTTTGTGTLTLAGAVTGFQAFSAIGNSNTTGYAIIAVDADGVPTGEWETGIGTYTSAGTTLSRGLIASSTGALVSFAAGTKHVICCDIAGYMTPLVMATTANRAIQIADQTALSSTAGNARGKGGTDLQSRRSSAAHVASGTYAVISGGRQNTASGNQSSVGGGRYNDASGNYATIPGGNANTASGTRSGIFGGWSSTASGYISAVIAGMYSTASGYHSIAFGRSAKALLYGKMAHASGRFSLDGDVQRGDCVVRRSTTDATQAELFLDGASSRIVLPSDSTWAFNALVVARRTDADNESAAYIISGCIDNNAGTTALVGTITVTVIAEDTAAWDVTAEADNTNDALVIKVTGEAAKTIYWAAHVRTVEVTG